MQDDKPPKGADRIELVLVPCPMCEPIPVKGCRECKDTRYVTPEDRRHIMYVLSRP